jgi:hypothetical protein
MVETFQTADNANMTVSEERMAEFMRVFSGEAPEPIIYAFRSWRAQFQFFPAECHIRGLIDRWHREKREAAEAKARRREKEAVEQARKEGKVLEFPDLVKELQSKLDSAPEPEHVKRHRQFRQRVERASLAVGTLLLSEEQIAARRERERAECEKYRLTIQLMNTGL